jgi:putative membrane protein
MAVADSEVPAPLPALTPLQTELIAKQCAKSGAARDSKYIAQRMAAHDQALAVQKAYAMGGTAPALNAAATEIAPVVQQHIHMLMMT